MNTTIIFLPKFPGFYESILSSMVDSEEEYMIDNLIEDGKIPADCGDKYTAMTNIIDIDYKKTHECIARQWCDLFMGHVTGLEKNTGIGIVRYVSLYSPQFYNYSSDEINVEVQYDIEKITAYLDSNREGFTAYIKEHNTSYDGFTAYLDNTFDAYIKELRDDMREAQLTQVIDFYIEKNHAELFDNNENFYDTITGMLENIELHYTYITK